MIMRMMKTMIMSNLIPGMKMKTRTKITVAVAAMKKTTITAAAPDSHGDRASNATPADNTKAGAKEANTAAKAVPARARGIRTRADARHPAAAGATLLMIAIRQHATPAKVAVADQTADHPRTTVAHPLLPVVAVHRIATPVAAAGLVHLPGTANQVLRGTVTRANNAMPADSSPAGVAVQAMAAGPIPVAAIGAAMAVITAAVIAAAAAIATAAAAIAVIANYS
jgi:hypothetical protein